jgi:hypothetical protein
MAEFFTHNAPDYGEEDTVLGPPGTSIADKLRRMALAMSLQAKSFSQDPLQTIVPWTRAARTIAAQIPSFASNHLRNLDPGDPGYTAPPKSTPESGLAGQYVGPNDQIAHNTIPGYIPRQNWQNAVRQDPLAGLIGPMQKPASTPPDVAPGY